MINSLKRFKRFLCGKRPVRDESADLYAKLINMGVYFDLRELETEQLAILLGNTGRLLDALLVELDGRGVDTDDLIEKLKDTSHNDADADKII